jgi:predicted glycogen debranching enzyme
LRLEVLVAPTRRAAIVTWTLSGDAADVTLHVRPLLSGRDYHALQQENSAFNFTTRGSGERLTWHTYPDQPVIISHTNGRWEQSPTWYRNFLYTAESQRGLDDREDLASPGEFIFALERGPAVWIVGIDDLQLADADSVIARERTRRAQFSSPLSRAADAYLVTRGTGKTIVAGYPWFTDWGRDTFIAMRGLCLATGRLGDARDILLEWAPTISHGMLPNRFPDTGDAPEYNSVDAALWYVVTTGELLAAAATQQDVLKPFDRSRLEQSIVAVLEGLAGGTRYGIRADADGLLACGTPGVQLTWMDAKVGERVITPRIGKPVEIQALWINALAEGAAISQRWESLLARATQSFTLRFWNEAAGCLYDVVDVDHVANAVVAAIRPNQVFAVGGLPRAVIHGDRARRLVDVLEAQLWTPLGLRTLSPGSAGYSGRYEGDPAARDAAYHQGTAWPWLTTSFVHAWLNVRGACGGNIDESADLHSQARQRFLAPLEAHLCYAGLGHVSEIVDADAPHTPRGCPFQAWSVGELIRLQQTVTYT